ncbi:MAG: porin family protein [Opitutaceae bacterium]|jgi:opacity protein-like surface antigen|nr:porin family protein [Opitutaceae bacterium]
MKLKTMLAALFAALVSTGVSADVTPTGSLALPKSNGMNHSFSLGANYEHEDDPGYGALATLDLRFARNHSLGITTGYNFRDQEFGYSGIYDMTIKWKWAPLHVSYNYHFLFGDRDRFEAHAGSIAGIEYCTATGTTSVTNPLTHQSQSYSPKFTGWSWVVGARAGFTWHFSKRFFLDASACFRRISDLSNKTELNGATYSIQPEDGNAKTVTVSIGWKF